MMQMSDMSTGMMLGMGLMSILVIVFLILGIAAFIKYLRS
jgi:Tfp pilus assembly protein PilX